MTLIGHLYESKKNFFPHDGKGNHIKSLDGLRGIAVLIVLLAHSHHIEDVNNIFQYFGRIGVYLFYILSAYLLDMQIINKLITEKASTLYWLNYCLRRFLRIIPVYLIALIIYYLFNRRLLGNFITSPSDILNSIFMLEAHGVFWSIPVEFKYYIFSPFLIIIFHKIFKWNLVLIIITVLTIYFFSMYMNYFHGLEWISLLKSIPAFLVGSLLAIFKVLNYTTKNVRVLEIVTVLGLIFFNMYMTEYFFVKEVSSLINIYLMPIFLGGIFISSQDGVLKTMMEQKALRFLGAISFSVYLFHMLFALGLRKYGFENSVLNHILYFLFTIVFSSFSYLLIEAPLSKFKFAYLKFSNLALKRIHRN